MGSAAVPIPEQRVLALTGVQLVKGTEILGGGLEGFHEVLDTCNRRAVCLEIIAYPLADGGQLTCNGEQLLREQKTVCLFIQDTENL